MNVIDYKKRPKRIKIKQTLNAETQKIIRSLIITLAIMIFVLGIVSLVSTNESAQRGYTLEQEKLKNENLKSIAENLTTKITKSTAFANIEEELKKEMKEAENKTYVTPEDNKVK